MKTVILVVLITATAVIYNAFRWCFTNIHLNVFNKIFVSQNSVIFNIVCPLSTPKNSSSDEGR